MSKHKPRSNTKAIKLFEAYMAAKGTPVAKPADVYRGAWWPHTETVSQNDNAALATDRDQEIV